MNQAKGIRKELERVLRTEYRGFCLFVRSRSTLGKQEDQFYTRKKLMILSRKEAEEVTIRYMFRSCKIQVEVSPSVENF